MTNAGEKTAEAHPANAGGPGPSQAALELIGVTAGYGRGENAKVILNDLNLAVRRGEFVSLVGPSGIGKTTMLRCIAGLLRPFEGEVRVEGRAVVKSPDRLAVVFQDYSRSLMPWLHVLSNVVLPLRGRDIPAAERKRRGIEALAAVGLADAAAKYPWQLSGGMQQRVAIARAVAVEPSVLVMDEPFASVDAQTRLDLEDLTLKLRADLGMTVLLVTHDIDEAVYMADRVVALGGRPTTIIETLDVDLGSDRDQVVSKALPAFTQCRGRVLELIRHRGEAGA